MAYSLLKSLTLNLPFDSDSIDSAACFCVEKCSMVGGTCLCNDFKFIHKIIGHSKRASI